MCQQAAATRPEHGGRPACPSLRREGRCNGGGGSGGEAGSASARFASRPLRGGGRHYSRLICASPHHHHRSAREERDRAVQVTQPRRASRTAPRPLRASATRRFHDTADSTRPEPATQRAPDIPPLAPRPSRASSSGPRPRDNIHIMASPPPSRDEKRTGLKEKAEHVLFGGQRYVALHPFPCPALPWLVPLCLCV